MNIDRDTTAIILYFDRIIFVYDYLDVVTIASQGFVDGVIYYLIHQVMESLFANIADVHGRALAYSF